MTTAGSVNFAGFFRELRHGHDNGPSLIEAVGVEGAASAEEARIVSYLQSATTLAATTAKVGDFINPEVGEIATASIRTDGRWAWPDDLAYYISTYHVDLPPEMLENLRENSFEAPAVPAARLSEIVSLLLDA